MPFGGVEVDQLHTWKPRESGDPYLRVRRLDRQLLALDELHDVPALEINRGNQHAGGGPDKARPPDARVLAFAGIARPERFFNALRSLGYDVAREMTFRDHHWYTAADIAAIQQAARAANAPLIVTTEKDAVRCDLDVAVLPMTVQIEPAADFESWLMGRLKA